MRFDTLRFANLFRIPLFKNSKGEVAHTKPDGSDWSPAQWLQAMFGELGEYARARSQYEAGEITYEEYCTQAKKELADAQIYLSILAARCLDTLVVTSFQSPAQILQEVIADLGEYANERKKFERGDLDTINLDRLIDVENNISSLRNRRILPRKSYNDSVTEAHPTGVELGSAVIQKFNEVSDRVGANVWLTEAGEVSRSKPNA